MLAGAQEEVTVQALLAAVLAFAQGILGRDRNWSSKPTSPTALWVEDRPWAVPWR